METAISQSGPQPDLDIWWRHPHLQNGVHAEKHEGRSLPGSLLRLEVSSIIIILIFVNRTLRRIKSSRLIGLVLHAVTLIFFKEHPSHSALCCDISVELSPFAVKSMFWLRYGPITSQEITYPDLVVARIVSVMNECRAPALSWAFACLLFLFHKDYFRILYKKYDLSDIKIFQNNSLFHPEMIRRPFFWFKDTKNTG